LISERAPLREQYAIGCAKLFVSLMRPILGDKKLATNKTEDVTV
jgi:hypothetical protein